MSLKTKVVIINYLPLVLLALPTLLMVYIKYGNPSENFFETINVVGAWILVSPILLICWGAWNSMFDDNKEEPKSCECCCKCKCCKNKII